MNFNYMCDSCPGAIYFLTYISSSRYLFGFRKSYFDWAISVHDLITVTAVGGCGMVFSSRFPLNVSCSQAPVAVTL